MGNPAPGWPVQYVIRKLDLGEERHPVAQSACGDQSWHHPLLKVASFKKVSRQLQCTVIGGKFKFEAQDSFLEYFFLRFGDLKNT